MPRASTHPGRCSLPIPLQYARYGVEASDITDAVDDIDTVIRDYHECETK